MNIDSFNFTFSCITSHFDGSCLAADYTQSLHVPEQQQQLIAQLQDASAQARIAAQENKNHPRFGGKSYEIDSLTQRIQSGMMVSPIEIEQALTPVSVQ